MSEQLLQVLITGLTIGAMYALAAVGFSMIYAASGVINFAQGEFMMLGGLIASVLYALKLPLPIAILGGLVAATLCGLLVYGLAVAPAKNADVIAVIIITMGASLVIRGLVQVVFGKGNHAIPAFSGEVPIRIGAAVVMPQTLWVLATLAGASVALGWYFSRTLSGKAMLAVSFNRIAAQLIGIKLRRVMLLAFGLSAAIGGIGGIVLTPITSTSYDVGLTLAMKGFVAAALGGLGSAAGALIGGLLLGVAESLTAGFISSAYKDAVSFAVLMVVLLVRPQGLFASGSSDRV